MSHEDVSNLDIAMTFPRPRRESRTLRDDVAGTFTATTGAVAVYNGTWRCLNDAAHVRARRLYRACSFFFKLRNIVISLAALVMAEYIADGSTAACPAGLREHAPLAGAHLFPAEP